MTDKIILWEKHKKRICEYYDCSDGEGRQYSDCTERGSINCRLSDITVLIEYLNNGRGRS